MQAIDNNKTKIFPSAFFIISNKKWQRMLNFLPQKNYSFDVIYEKVEFFMRFSLKLTKKGEKHEN